MTAYVFGKETKLPFSEVVNKVTAELAKEGFGVLTEIDVAATLKKKLDLDIPPYKILGACNPQFASQAIAAEPQIGALLPCNVVVRQDAASKVYLEFMDPNAVLDLVKKPGVHAIAAQVREKLLRVMKAV